MENGDVGHANMLLSGPEVELGGKCRAAKGTASVGVGIYVRCPHLKFASG